MFKPILFNTEMVQAIKSGRKTQTRRVAFVADALREFSCASYPDGWWYEGRIYKSFESFVRDCQTPKCKYRPGDILWVRETWCENKNPNSQDFGGYEYRADYEGALCQDLITWHPSIHMPKEAARIFLRVKDVRVERLQDITEEQAEKEGCSSGRFPAYGPSDGFFEAPEEWDAVEDFQRVWDTTIKTADRDVCGWEANPWVWVIEFERIKKPEEWK